MKETAPDDAPSSLVIERTFDAPRELVWRMWTDAERFATWYGPRGATIPLAMMDVNVGGRRFLRMEMAAPGGTMQMWFTGEYREIVDGERLVYTESMADADGHVLPLAKMGLPEGIPAITEVRVELLEQAGRTTMTMTHGGVPPGSPAAAGWNMAFDKLEERLAGSAA